MIELRPMASNDEIKKLFELNGLLYNGTSGCVSAVSGSKMLGYCLYDMDSESITVRFITPGNDALLADGILRSTLHVAAERGIMKAFYDISADEKLLETLRFIKDKTDKRLNMNLLFESCQNCGK